MSLKLVEKIEYGDKNIFNLTDVEANQILKLAVNTDRYDLLIKINEPCIGRLENGRNPDWLKCLFEDNIWYVEFINGSSKKFQKCKIDFNITFGSEKLKLTSPRFTDLLHNLKLWIISSQDRRNFNRDLIQGKTRYVFLRSLLKFIDFLFLNADKIYLSQLGIKCIDSDLVKSYIALEMNGGINATYAFDKNLKALAQLSENIITDEDVSKFEEKFGVDILASLLNKEYDINAAQQKKLVVFLYNKSMYKGSGFGKHTTSGNVNKKNWLNIYIKESACFLMSYR